MFIPNVHVKLNKIVDTVGTLTLRKKQYTHPFHKKDKTEIEQIEGRRSRKA